MDVLPSLMQHINNTVRRFVPPDLHYFLCLDGHSSRNGTEWIELYQNNNCEAVVGAANTSHFLQPCYQNVNRRFNSSIRHFRDELCKASLIYTRQVAVNLACGVHGFESITLEDARLSFRNTGIYPFDPAFPLRFAKTDFVTGGEVEKEKARLENAGVASRLPAVRQRQSDTPTLSQVISILEGTEGPLPNYKNIFTPPRR